MSNTPILLHNLAAVPIRHIAAGGRHSAVVTKSGVIYSWGYNGDGQLGHGGQISTEEPKEVGFTPHEEVFDEGGSI